LVAVAEAIEVAGGFFEGGLFDADPGAQDESVQDRADQRRDPGRVDERQRRDLEDDGGVIRVP